MSKSLNVGVLVAARDEYIEQLKSIISPLIIQGVNSIYQDALKVSQGRNVIITFQQFLKDVITWNQTILQEEAKRIKTKCPYIMDIVTAIFVSNVKILASIRLKGDNENIKVKIPSCEIFVHSVYIETAQQIFYDPMLFYHRNGNFNQIQKNKKYVREIIETSIEESIRKMMPFAHILEEYLKNALDDNAEYDSSSESDASSEAGDVLNNDKIINETEDTEEEEPEQNTTKNLHIDGLSSYIKENPPAPPPPPILPDYNNFNNNNNFNQNENYGSESSDNSDTSSENGSESSSSSFSSSSSGSTSSGSSSGSSSKGRREHKQIKENNNHHHREHHRDRHGHRENKHKYSFF
jgi:hypothetical protein